VVAAAAASTAAAAGRASASAGLAPPPLGRSAAASAAAVGGNDGGDGGDGGRGTLAATAAVRERFVAVGFGLAVAAVYASTVPAAEDAACAGRTLQITDVAFVDKTDKHRRQKLTVRPDRVRIDGVPCVATSDKTRLEGDSGGTDGAFERLLHLTVRHGNVTCGGAAARVRLREGSILAFGLRTADGVPIANVGACRFAAPAGSKLGAPLEDPSCFPAEAMVTLSSGTPVRMAALRVGDVVVTGPATTSPVFGFSHADAAGAARYVTLTAGAAGTLIATPGHYVRVGPAACGASAVPPSGACAATASRLVAAAAVRVGDLLLAVPPPPPPSVGAGGTGGGPPGGGGPPPTARPAGATAGGAAAPAAVWAPVTAISVDAAPVARGLYNPHTLDGGVVVDGFAASTFTAAVAPGVAAVALAPARAAFAAGWGGVVGARWLPVVGGARVPAALGGRPSYWGGDGGGACSPL